MASPTSELITKLEGTVVTCPLCRSETIELRTTSGGDSLTGFCSIQRSPYFLNEPKRLDSDLIPDELTEDDQDDLEQESKPWEPEPEGWCYWCSDPIMPADISENDDGEMEADHGFEDCDEMGIGKKKTYVYDKMLDEPPEEIGEELLADGDEDSGMWKQ